MAFYESVRASDTTTRSGGSIFARLVSAFAQWNETRKTRAALSRLSDRELDDIGLDRSDIERL